MSLYLIEAPEQDDVLTVAEAKQHMRVDFDDDDGLIGGYIATAIQSIDGRDGWLGRALGEQTWELRLPAFCGSEIKTPLPPLIEAESVKYYDANDTLQTLFTGDYEVVGIGGFGKARVVLKTGKRWPSIAKRAESVVVRFRAGYITGAEPSTPNVPEVIKQAVRLMVADSFEARGGNFVAGSSVDGIGAETYRRSSVQPVIERLLTPLRVW